jgi:hypothetical protein
MGGDFGLVVLPIMLEQTSRTTKSHDEGGRSPKSDKASICAGHTIAVNADISPYFNEAFGPLNDYHIDCRLWCRTQPSTILIYPSTVQKD